MYQCISYLEEYSHMLILITQPRVFQQCARNCKSANSNVVFRLIPVNFCVRILAAHAIDGWPKGKLKMEPLC